MMKKLAIALLAALLLAATVLWMLWRNDRPAPVAATSASTESPVTPATIERGRYLALAGNCQSCHTARGGAAYAGGRGIDTPFGLVYTSNLTPDAATGLGGWSRGEFYEAMHHGRSRDGRLLYPAFPYPSFTQITRDDADALFAYLQSLPPVAQKPPAHALRFPYNSQLALVVWRALYFRPADPAPDDPQRSPAWNRGRYLVQGLTHCAACHASRNALGASDEAFSGALMPDRRWVAPALGQEPKDDLVRLLKTGQSSQGSALGPMADVVFDSTQHLNDDDLEAIADYLHTFPPAPAAAPPGNSAPPDAGSMLLGAKLYETHCADCHGAQGQGRPDAYPRLAGNRTVTMDSPVNLVRAIVSGGFAPATAGNPRPYSMPPFGQQLSPAELAALVTYLRGAWGHQGRPLSATELLNAR